MIPRRIARNRILAPLTTYGIGGEAQFFAEPASMEEMAWVYSFARIEGLPVHVLGGGSNLLVADSGVSGIVMRLDSSAFGGIEPDPAHPLIWRVGAAATLASVVEKAARAGLAGIECLAGIPGRIGGAAVMNAGGAETGIGRIVAAVQGLDASGKPFVMDAAALRFGYRSSALTPGMTVLSLTLCFLGQEDPAVVIDRTRSFRERKRAAQPMGAHSAGCVFKNPAGRSAGALLDAAGCKGMREGGAEVSAVHANFIVNTGGASSADVVRLAARMREAVRAAHGVSLEPEIRIWGDEPGLKELGM